MSARVPAALRDNGLSLVFAAIFVLALAGQAVFGVALYNQDQVSADSTRSRSGSTSRHRRSPWT